MEKKETVAVRNMPEGTKAALVQLAEANGRSLEGEARYAIKQHLAFHLSDGVGVVIPDKDLATERAEACVQAVQARCDSVRRKLAGGSVAVTTDDLERLETELLGARLKLGELSPKHPQALLHARQ